MAAFYYIVEFDLGNNFPKIYNEVFFCFCFYRGSSNSFIALNSMVKKVNVKISCFACLLKIYILTSRTGK